MRTLSKLEIGVAFFTLIMTVPTLAQNEVVVHVDKTDNVPIVSTEGFSSMEGGPESLPARQQFALSNIKIVRNKPSQVISRSHNDQWAFEARLTNTGAHSVYLPISGKPESDFLRQCAGRSFSGLDVVLTSDEIDGQVPVEIIGQVFGCPALEGSTVELKPSEWVTVKGDTSAPATMQHGTAGLKMSIAIHDEVFSEAPGGWHSKQLSQSRAVYEKYLFFP